MQSDLSVYRWMVLCRVLDHTLCAANPRWFPCEGEEATIVGSFYDCGPADIVAPHYRDPFVVYTHARRGALAADRPGARQAGGVQQGARGAIHRAGRARHRAVGGGRSRHLARHRHRRGARLAGERLAPASASAPSGTAPRIGATSTRTSTSPPRGGCRSFTSARTTAGRSRNAITATSPRRSSPAPPATASPASPSMGRMSRRCARRSCEAAARARAGEGPTLIEARTIRLRGHWAGDNAAYRADADQEAGEDPLDLLAARLLDRGEATDDRRRGAHRRRERRWRRRWSAPRRHRDVTPADLGVDEVYA